MGDPSSFGPGVYSNFDIQLQIFFSSSKLKGRLFDPTRQYPVPLTDGTVGGQPCFVDDLFHSFKRVRIYDYNNNLVNPSTFSTINWEKLKTAVLETWDGALLTFEITQLDPPGTYGTTSLMPTDPLYGRLISITNRQGYSTTITYESHMASDYYTDPALQFRIDTVSDLYGRTISFTYTSSPVGGWYAVEEIDVPDHGTIAYDYSSNLLSEVTGLDSQVSTFTSSLDATSGMTVVHFDDKAATGTHRKKDVYLSNSEGTPGVGDTQLYPSSTLLVRMVSNGAEEASYFNAYVTYYQEQVYEGGGKMKYVNANGPREVKYYNSDWTMASSGPAIGEGDIEASGETYAMGAGSNYQAGAPSAEISSDGTRVNHLYDSDYAITHSIYSDGTWESFCYNDRKQVTRYRDRLARVTRNTYDSIGNLTVKEVGLVEDEPSLTIDPYSESGPDPCAEDDVQTADYAVFQNEYYGGGDDHPHLLKKVIDPNGNETDYEYDVNHRLAKVIEPPDEPMGARAETTFEYDSAGRLSLVTNAVGHETAYEYDDRDRVTRVVYEDGSTDRYIYGTGDEANLLVKLVNRRNVVTKYEYDDAGRRTRIISAAATMDAMGTETSITDPALRSETVYEYLPGCTEPSKVTAAGDSIEYVYDHRHRVIQTKSYASVSTELVTSNTYVDNKLFKTQDPYGRAAYYAYDASDGRLIRTILTTVPDINYADFEEILSAVRTAENAGNSTSIITDILYDAVGQRITAVDARGYEHVTDYDTRGRVIAEIKAAGSSVETRTETSYDSASNVTQIRTPRYFDASDPNGHNKAKTTIAFTGRNRVKTETDAPSTAEEGTSTSAYDKMGRITSKVDMEGKTWSTAYLSCCGRTIVTTDPLGHGTIIHTNAAGQATHVIAVSNVSTHMSLHNPTDGETQREVTMQYDLLGRKTAETRWLTPLGLVDPDDPPIYMGTPVNDSGNPPMFSTYGLTTTWTYDSDLSDGVGLDSMFDSLMTGLPVGADCDGSAVLTTLPSGERNLVIHDGLGRTVRTAQVDSSGAALVTSTVTRDAVVLISGYGDVLETAATDQAGHTTKSRVDSAGRTIEVVDGAGKATKFIYNTAGSCLSIRDPNGIGQDRSYDALGRVTEQVDTASNVISQVYDRNGSIVAQADAKANSSSVVYDARGRRVKEVDRVGGETEWAFDLNGNLVSMLDAEGQATIHEYDDRGQRIKTTWPDHVAMSSVGTTGFGVTEVAYTPAGEVLRTTNQLGDTVTRAYDLAGRATKLEARVRANSPSGTVAFVDSYTYDAGSRLLVAISGQYGNTVTRTYTDGRLASDALTIGGQTYSISASYDFSVPKLTLAYPDGGTVERTLNSRGLLSTVKLGATTVLSRSYDDGRRLVQQTLGNGVVEDFGYVTADNLPATRETAAGDFAFTWDANKNKTSESVSGAMSAYGWSTGMSGFDDADRLLARNQGAGGTQLNESWNLSLVGSMDATTTNGVTTNRTHGPAHELLAIGATSIASDLKGNLLNDVNGRTFEWDWSNQLKSADLNADSMPDITVAYDALGRRVARTAGGTTAVFFSFGRELIADYPLGAAPGAPDRIYVSSGRIDEPVVMVDCTSAGALGAGISELFYYHHDANWHVRGLTNSAGAVQELYAYSSYGLPIFLDQSGNVISGMAGPVKVSPVGNRLLFTSREWDPDTSTYDFRSRAYSPSAGRFLNRDPIEFVDGSSLYNAYFVPSMADPKGLWNESGHFYTTYFCARLSGRNHVDSRRLAYWSQYPDEMDAFDAYFLTVPHFFTGPFNEAGAAVNTKGSNISEYDYRRKIKKYLHQLHGLWGEDLSNNRDCLRKHAKGLLAGTVDQQRCGGVLLHALGDTYAHSWYDTRTQQWRAYDPALGHGLSGHAPDQICNRLGSADCSRSYRGSYPAHLRDMCATLGVDMEDPFNQARMNDILRMMEFLRSKVGSYGWVSDNLENGILMGYSLPGGGSYYENESALGGDAYYPQGGENVSPQIGLMNYDDMQACLGSLCEQCPINRP